MDLYENNEDTPRKIYRPNKIDEYIVVVNLPEDWEEVHNYIINENEIDGIPNRKIECTNDKVFSLRSSVYKMSHDEAQVLKTHPKVEEVELNPEKFPQPESLFSLKFRKDVAFNKPRYTGAADSETTSHTNSVRSNWSHLFVNGEQLSSPFQGVGITTTTKVDRDINFSLTGRGVDAVIIDSGVSVLHPDFIADDGSYRVRDVILDGPYKADPAAFSGYTETVTIDGVNIGTRAQEARARSWWSTTSVRSAAFQSLGTLSIPATYTRIHAHSKNGTNAVSDSHGTSCASQIGGNWHGLAFECNLWNIRIALGGVGGIISSSTALDACTIFHNAKKIAQDVADPTLINNSYGSSSSTGNTNGTSYTIGYRGNTQTYTGSGSLYTIPANSGGARCNATFTYHNGSSSTLSAYSAHGKYLNSGSTTSSAAENAIAAGCIVVASAGNNNMKISDKDDVDFGNWYGNSSTFINRAGGIQKGFSGDHLRNKGSIRVGALDCAVEPVSAKQGSTAYKFRKVTYSSNGPMINVWAPAEYTMAAAYASGEDYAREDDSNYYDKWFNGTSSAGPNACSVIALELQTNRKATQNDIHEFLATGNGAITTENLSDPYPDSNDAAYWSMTYNATYDSSNAGECYNVRGNGNLRGAPKRVLNNPYASNLKPTFANASGGENIITDQLFLNLDAANYSSGSTWNDSGGNALNATLNGPTYNSNFGGYFDFDGTDDNATLPTLAIAGNELTFSVWNFGIQSKNSSIIFLGQTNGNRILNVHLPYSENKIYFDKGHGGGGTSYDRINKTGTVADWEGWHHWAFTANAVTGNMRIYRDGVLYLNGNGKTKTFLNVTGNRRTIGQWHTTGGYHRGYISNMQIYKKQLSKAEVIHNFDAMKGRFEQRPLILSGVSYTLT